MTPDADYRRLLAEGFAEEARAYGPPLVDSDGVRWAGVYHVRAVLGLSAWAVVVATMTGRRVRGRTWRFEWASAGTTGGLGRRYEVVERHA